MKNKFWITSIVLAIIVHVYCFWPGHLYFLNDDLLHIPLTDHGHFFQTNSIRPLHELLVRLDLFVWGKNAYGYHITALLLHLVVCIQLYSCCFLLQTQWLQINKLQAKKAAMLAVFLFLIYPQASETSAWIIGRAPILSAVFLLITLRQLVKENCTLTGYFIGTFCFAAALFTYEQCILFPMALFFLGFFGKDETRRRYVFTYAFTLCAVSIMYILIRRLITSEIIGAYEGGNLLSFNWKVLSGNAFRLFFRLFLNPADKFAFVVSAFCLLLIIIGLVIFSLKKVVLNKRAIFFFTAILILLMAPIISLGIAVNSFESGRYLYLPSLFMIAGISIAGIAVFYQKKSLQNPFIALLLVLTGYWLYGKYSAAKDYTAASSYAQLVEASIQQHFKNSSDTMYINTLHVTINRLPVFRLGFKTGINWLNSSIDTNKIVVKNFIDESIDLRKKSSF